MNFGKLLKSLLEEHNLTQSAFGKEIGYTQRAVSKWVNEQSEPTEEVIFRTANFFGLSADYLLGRADDFGNVAVASPASSLSAEEQKLIKNFRAMRSDLQAYYLEMSETFIQKPENLTQQDKTKGEKRNVK